MSDTQSNTIGNNLDIANNLATSSCSSISGNSYEEDQELLEECILSGMPQSTGENEDLNDEALLQECILEGMLKNQQKSDLDDLESEEEDKDILADVGMKSNRYTVATEKKAVRKKQEEMSSDDELLLSDCVKVGMKVAQRRNLNISIPKGTLNARLDLDYSAERNLSDDELSSLSNDSCDSEQLLRECIASGMAKQKPFTEESELTETDKALLQQCILEGMQKCHAPKRSKENDEISEEDQLLLRQCILSGMPKMKKSPTSPSKKFTELTESDRALLQQCILAGMPRTSGAKSAVNRNINKMRRMKEREPEHACCIHCPKNQKKSKDSIGKIKRKHKTQVQIKDSRDVNILYVTSQILTLNKETLKRAHEEWV